MPALITFIAITARALKALSQPLETSATSPLQIVHGLEITLVASKCILKASKSTPMAVTITLVASTALSLPQQALSRPLRASTLTETLSTLIASSMDRSYRFYVKLWVDYNRSNKILRSIIVTRSKIKI